MHGTTVSNFYNKYCNLPKITGVTANDNRVSIIGKDIDLSTKNKVIEVLNKNNFEFNNLDSTDMQISATFKSEDVNPSIRCMHDLFFKNGINFS